MEFIEQDISIGFKPFDLSKENLASKVSTQIESEITFTKGHESIEVCPEKTAFMKFRYSPFPTGSGPYAKKSEERNYLEIMYDNDKYSDKTKKVFQKYTDAYLENQDTIYQQDSKKKTYYTFLECVRTNENDVTGKITVKSKLSIKPNTNYYYNNEMLNEKNVREIKKTMFGDKKKRTGTEFKDYIRSLTYKINYPQDSQEFVVARFGPGEIEDRKEITLKVHYREIEDFNPDTMPHPDDCETEEELNRHFGNSTEIMIKSPEDMDKYCVGNSFYQFGFYAEKLWGHKTKNPTTKIANTGIKFICSSLNVIRIKKYGNIATKQSRDDLCDKYLTGKLEERDLLKPSEAVATAVSDTKKTDSSSGESESESEEEAPKPTKKSSKVEEPKKAVSKSKVSKKEESSDESSDESSSEDSEDEPEPPKKSKSKK